MAKAVAQKSNSVKVSNPNEPLIILDWTKLDPSVSSMERLRDQVSFLLSQYRKAILESSETNMEVVVKLESPGGSVADYGLAAEQLIRLRDEPGITLTICVDKVAASGGYMLAVTSSPGRLFAAPFAMLGSIGVVAQVLNFHKALEGYGVTDIVLRSGKGKAPLGNLGEITKDQKDRSQKMIDAVHVAFKKHVVKNRPELKGSIDKIGNGDVWLGVDALEKKLVDRITTSDEYICQRIVEGARCLLMVPYQKHHRAIGGPFSPAQFMRSIESMFLKAVDSLGVNQLLEGRPGPKEQSLRLSASSSSDLFPKAKM
jgi:serine protease SohB